MKPTKAALAPELDVIIRTTTVEITDLIFPALDLYAETLRDEAREFTTNGETDIDWDHAADLRTVAALVDDLRARIATGDCTLTIHTEKGTR